jgi:RimJ/RimL family protein N-acetyltransferase
MESATQETLLRDGSTATIRPVVPDDVAHLRAIYGELSVLSRRRRFLTPVSDPSDEDLAYLTDVDHRRHEALVAFDRDGRAVGEARYVRSRDDRSSAELAVVVVDDWHGRGLATALLDSLTERARENGIETYTAIVDPGNDLVIGALERAGAERTGRSEEGEVEFSVAVPSEGIGDRLRAALHAAAETPWAFVSTLLRRLAVWRHSG